MTRVEQTAETIDDTPTYRQRTPRNLVTARDKSRSHLPQPQPHRRSRSAVSSCAHPFHSAAVESLRTTGQRGCGVGPVLFIDPPPSGIRQTC